MFLTKKQYQVLLDCSYPTALKIYKMHAKKMLTDKINIFQAAELLGLPLETLTDRLHIKL